MVLTASYTEGWSSGRSWQTDIIGWKLVLRHAEGEGGGERKLF